MPADLLSDSTVAFIEREVAIDLASCSATLRPSSCRGFACRVSADRRRITVFVRRTEASQLLQDVLSQDTLAAVYCLPETEAAIQIKGHQVSLQAASTEDMAAIEDYCQRFLNGIVQIGFDRTFGQTHMSVESGQMVALSFTPLVVFEQTPGPRAGQPIPGASA